MKPKQYYYLIKNRIMSSTKRLPKTNNVLKIQQFFNSLQPCEISGSELDRIITYLQKTDAVGWTGSIEVTDIVSDNNGVITFKEKYKQKEFLLHKWKHTDTIGMDKEDIFNWFMQHPKQVDGEIEAVEFAEWLFLERYSKTLNLMISTKERKAFIDNCYEIFKNKK